MGDEEKGAGKINSTIHLFFSDICVKQSVMNSSEIKAFIRKHSSLFWYIPEDKKEDISEDILVEFILNYGSLEDVKELFRIMGIKRVAEIFFESINKS